MKKVILSILVVASLVGCSKLQNDSPTTFGIEMSSQNIFSQNVSALQLIGKSVLNNEQFSFEENKV